MIGGGRGAFIGGVHRMAAALDGQIELIAGAFSSDAAKSKLSGGDLYLDPTRIYGSYEEMIHKESQLPNDVKIDLISIVTPNHMHFGPIKMALENGFHVICDKPLCFDLKETYQLKNIVEKSDKIFALTHNYTGYPMVKQAKHIIQNGELGAIRKVVIEYSQGWLGTLLESQNQKQAAWRTDPSKSGVAGAMGDIGSHAENLTTYITGLNIQSICADIGIVVKGRKLDDDGTVLIRYTNGARGVLTASQISIGEENNLNIKVYGEKASLAWSQMIPNTLRFLRQDLPDQIIRTGQNDLCQVAQAHTRIPSGHPEGYLEAFANIYRNVAKCIQADLEGEAVDPIYLDYPGIEEGVKGMEFIHKVIESGNSDVKWLDL
jgi:predicted dehydrogenase